MGGEEPVGPWCNHVGMDAAISSTYIDNAGRLITTDISMTTNQLTNAVVLPGLPALGLVPRVPGIQPEPAAR